MRTAKRCAPHIGSRHKNILCCHASIQAARTLFHGVSFHQLCLKHASIQYSLWESGSTVVCKCFFQIDRLNSTISSEQTEAKQPARQGRDDHCLCFSLHPSSMVYSMMVILSLYVEEWDTIQRPFVNTGRYHKQIQYIDMDQQSTLFLLLS